MPTVYIRFRSELKRVDVQPGASVLDACKSAGLPVVALCGGELACSTCHVIVDPAWLARVARASEAEEDMLDLVATLTPTSRLGCQLRVDESLDGILVELPE